MNKETKVGSVLKATLGGKIPFLSEIIDLGEDLLTGNEKNIEDVIDRLEDRIEKLQKRRARRSNPRARKRIESRIVKLREKVTRLEKLQDEIEDEQADK